ncbi:MAG: hypothetical protein V4631_01475 [Pseudomonadota bacterium]
MDNFKSEGNFLTGRTYKTWAVVAGVRQGDAFSRALAFTVANGFTVTASDKEAGVISAAQTVSFGKGKTVPLGVIIQPDAGNLKISMNYATSGGVTSPEGAIKKHFCMTIAAASEGGSAAEAATNTGIVPPPNPNKLRGVTTRGFATPTEAQQEAFTLEIGKNVANAKMRPLVKDATPAIANFIGKLACVVDSTGSRSLNEYGAPGVELHNRYVSNHPMYQARYHDKGSCMSVTRVHGWASPANNALEFEVVYKAEDSGEIKKLTHEAVRQPDGAWMFTR